MKLYLLISLCLIFSCNTASEKKAEKTLERNVFISILKDIHLNEAICEINNTNNKLNSENNIITIFNNHQITETDFKKTLEFYSENPQELEDIYTDLIYEIKQMQSTVDPQ